ncbi:Hypp7189 [Branchiostoma lanceolatum]|uniref:Hypp7189 protein n=1 Tax=Branchiostoma lanceolatum TaxID=7740 RepID=A0A8K0ECB4_BRALA|nr:Hypp7189 [Branchiostoma lanceolatum]
MPQHSYYGEGQLLGWSNKTYKRRRERQRVAELNDALSRLKQLVPSVRELPFPNRGRGHDRLTKVGILRAAVGYIRHMQETLRTDVSEAVLKEGRTHGGDLVSLSGLCDNHGLESTHCDRSSPPAKLTQTSAELTLPDWRVSSTTPN